MDHKLLLAKAFSLLCRESQLDDKAENSNDLIRTVLEDVKVSEIGVGIGGDRESILALKATILEMCSHSHDHVYDKSELLQRVRINAGNDEKFYDALRQGIQEDMNEIGLKRVVLNLRKSINNHFRETKIGEVVSKASSSFKFEREKIKDINQYIDELIAQLEPLRVDTGTVDPAIISDVDLGDDDELREQYQKVHSTSNGSKLYRTGWTALNRMLQGGMAPGKTVLLGALQHKYKTGFTLTLLKQLALYNKPFTEDPKKKPLILRISFEDELSDNLQFLYQSLKYDETRQYVDIKNTSAEEMQKYVKKRLQVNGFHIKLLRVDPTQWTYRSICNKVIELEAQGYNVEILMLDYLLLVPTTGCVTTGAMGTDKRDLLRRIRNFCSAKNILHITPHQLSTEAKKLTQGQVPDTEFVQFVTEKGYHEGSKQLDQELDIELYIHKFMLNKVDHWLAVQLGKHRVPTILENFADKLFFLKFPKRMPIPDDDIEAGEDQSVRKLPTRSGNASEELFEFA